MKGCNCMKIVDLTPEHEKSYFLCLEDWSADAKEAGNRRELWYGKMKGKGLRVKLALDDQGVPGRSERFTIFGSRRQRLGIRVVRCWPDEQAAVC